MRSNFFKIVIAAIVVIVLLQIFYGSRGADDNKKLIGRWYCENESEYLQLFSDGTGVVEYPNSYDFWRKSAQVSSWKIYDGKLKLDLKVQLFGEYSILFDYKVGDDTLILTHDGEDYIYTKE